MVCELAVLNRADGSAKWTQENTSVMAAVYGPRQAMQRKEDAEQAVIEVVFKPRSGIQGNKEKEYELIIRGALEALVQRGLFPRTSIMVVLQVVADGGSLLSVALNAACAALVDAGVPMSACFASVTCAVGAQQGELLVDPEENEEQAAQATVVCAFAVRYGLPADSSTAPPAQVDEGALIMHTWPGKGAAGTGAGAAGSDAA
eukprot:CAMPEP_0202877488 /NCGR_PEP_ID=MMETSP1391-20130828/30728_1 /ASSEMBLY_ACC=CAM_ASM_000867 /TAXON_ID=1034604 /ORGANISM="Chlamydomonas leiostraca, Strain SAG 11-49" /LENGTH=202 /DNA_ID=CAMNT_0049559533 /DNA_START=35 /DNA_END=639 /DNA_ORIENTATION=+